MLLLSHDTDPHPSLYSSSVGREIHDKLAAEHKEAKHKRVREKLKQHKKTRKELAKLAATRREVLFGETEAGRMPDAERSVRIGRESLKLVQKNRLKPMKA